MNEEAEKRIAAKLAKAMAILCVRTSRLEDLHAGTVPVTKTGDWSDVLVLDAIGQRTLQVYGEGEVDGVGLRFGGLQQADVLVLALQLLERLADVLVGPLAQDGQVADLLQLGVALLAEVVDLFLADGGLGLGVLHLIVQLHFATLAFCELLHVAVDFLVALGEELIAAGQVGLQRLIFFLADAGGQSDEQNEEE